MGGGGRINGRFGMVNHTKSPDVVELSDSAATSVFVQSRTAFDINV
jgi:hypothetical protein